MVLPNLGGAAAARWRALFAVGLALLASACAGSGEGLDANGRPIGEGGSGPPPGGNVDFATLQNTIFTPTCAVSGCHAGAAAPLGLRLEAGLSYAMLVNVASVEVPTLLRVAPGDPDASYLVHKIEGRAAVGARMPLGGSPLPQTSIDDVRQWISQGAPPPVSPLLAGPQPVNVVATAPADGEEAMVGLRTLLVVFDREIDASLVNTSTVALIERSGEEGGADAGSEREVALASIRVPSGNPTSVWLRTRSPLVAGVYELRVRANGATALADIGGNVLDGDRDGIAGGDLRVSFRVTEGTP